MVAKAVLLGVLQGATEFLPVSSSGHLVLGEALIGVPQTGLAFEVAVHLATTLAVIVVFRRRVWAVVLGFFRLVANVPRVGRIVREDRDARWAAGIIVGTVPAAFAGLLFEEQVEIAFASPLIVGLFLSFTGAVLLLTAVVPRDGRRMTLGRAFVVGCAQAVAILPGISRSGSTIAAGLFLRVRPQSAAEFSFILSIPAVLGATIVKAFDASREGFGSMPAAGYAVAALCAFAVGAASLAWLIRIVRRGRFAYFGLYCLSVGTAAVLYFL